jgi:hypothetical protein
MVLHRMQVQVRVSGAVQVGLCDEGPIMRGGPARAPAEMEVEDWRGRRNCPLTQICIHYAHAAYQRFANNISHPTASAAFAQRLKHARNRRRSASRAAGRCAPPPPLAIPHLNGANGGTRCARHAFADVAHAHCPPRGRRDDGARAPRRRWLRLGRRRRRRRRVRALRRFLRGALRAERARDARRALHAARRCCGRPRAASRRRGHGADVCGGARRDPLHPDVAGARRQRQPHDHPGRALARRGWGGRYFVFAALGVLCGRATIAL